MLYLRLDSNDNPVEYPLEERHLRAALSNASLPEVLTRDVINPLGYDFLYPATDPLPQETATHRAVITGCAQGEDGIWRREYSLQEITEDRVRNFRLDRKWAEVRLYRDQLMRLLDWRIARNQRETRLGLETTEDIADLDNMMQQLADIGDADDPFLINFNEITMI